MSTFIPPTPAATKSAEQHEEPSEQDSFNHLLYKVLRLTSEQVQDLNDWMKHRGIPNAHEIIAQNFCKPHALQDDLQFIRGSKPFYIQSNVMVSQPIIESGKQLQLNTSHSIGKMAKATLLTSSANIGSLQLCVPCSSLSCSGGARLPPS